MRRPTPFDPFRSLFHCPMRSAATESAPPEVSSPPRFFSRLCQIVEKSPGLSGTEIQKRARVAQKAVSDATAYAIENKLIERRPVSYVNKNGVERVRDGLFLVGDRRSGPDGRRKRGPDPKMVAGRTRRLAEICLPALLARLKAQDGLSAWQLREDPALADYGADVDKALALALERRLIYEAATPYLTAGNQHRTRKGFYLGAGPAEPPRERLEGPDLKKRRLELGRSLAQLADELGVHVMTLVSWEQRWMPPGRVEERRKLDDMTRLPTPEEQATALVETLVRIAEANAGLSRGALLSRLRRPANMPADARPLAHKLVHRAFEIARRDDRVCERRISPGRWGVYAGKMPPDEDAPPTRLAGTWIQEQLERLDWTRADLAASLDATESAVAYWQTYGVPPKRIPALREAVERPTRQHDRPRKGALERLPEVLAAIDSHRGLTRSELSRRFFCDSRAARAAIRLAIESDKAHLLPVTRPRGRSHMTVYGVYPGPAPALEDDFAAALRKARRAEGLTQAKLGKLLERSGASVSKWETRQQPVPRELRAALCVRLPELAAVEAPTPAQTP